MTKLLNAFFCSTLALALTGCQVGQALDSVNGMGKKLDATNEKMEGMGDSLAKTKNAIHLQVLGTALTELDKKENWAALSPVPFGLLAAGKAFAEEATATELMDFFRKTINEISESKLSPFIDPLTGDQTPYVISSAEYNAIRVEKVAKYMTLQTIAGFTPDKTVQEIVQTQIIGATSVKSRSHEKTAINFLALRHQFIHDVLLHASLMDKGIQNVGEIEEAIELNLKVEMIDKMKLRQPIASDVKVALNVQDKAGANSIENMDFSGTIDTHQSLNDWRTLQSLISAMNFGPSEMGLHLNDSPEILRRDEARAAGALNFVNGQIASFPQD